MSRVLNVYLEYDLVGQLQYDQGQMSFEYAKTWLKKTTAIEVASLIKKRCEKVGRQFGAT
jgi:HipA-like protein